MLEKKYWACLLDLFCFNKRIRIRIKIKVHLEINFSFIRIGETGCGSYPCLHNSTCENLIGIYPSLAYQCHCQTGYTGRNCEVGKNKIILIIFFFFQILFI